MDQAKAFSPQFRLLFCVAAVFLWTGGVRARTAFTPLTYNWRKLKETPVA